MKYSQDSHTIAKILLGSKICRKFEKKNICIIVTEVEVYDGHNDKASHASRGKTKRTKIMFGPAGYWYVYLCYGIHWMLNLVTREEGYPAAILIRSGIDEKGRKVSGPGRMTKFLKVTGKLNALRATKDNGLWIIWRRSKLKTEIKKSPRIGVDYAGPLWSKKHWRYILDNK